MQVLIVGQYSIPHIGGIELIMDQEIQALEKMGHQVTVVTSDGSGRQVMPQYSNAVKVIRIPSLHILEKLFSIPYPIFHPGFLKVLWREARASDVVHIHGSLGMAALPSLLFAKWLRKPSLLTEHVVFQQKRLFQLGWILEQLGLVTVGRICAKLCTRLIAYNDRVLSLMEKMAGTSKGRFVPYIINTRIFRPPTSEEKIAARKTLGWDDMRPKILFVGRLIADKGIFLLLQAKSPDYDLVFCGPGHPKVQQKLIDDGATYLGSRKQSEMLTIYHAADVLVQPSCREGFPLVVKEALACGLRVILADDIGYRSYYGLPGLFFCERDPADLRRAIYEVLSTNNPFFAPTADEASASHWISSLYGGLNTSLA